MQEPLEFWQEEPPRREILTVSQLNRAARAALEGSFPLIWVEGEISNLAKPSSGHLYFTLKDEAASVRCAMFRNRNLRLGFTPANGTHVVLRAQVSLYEGRGEFQLIAEHMEEAGAGALRRAFEALKQRLASEGLFDAAHKKPLPALPRRIGVVTSPSGAAIRDILTVLKRRFPSISVIIYPAQVQGTGAAAQIAQAIRTASRRKDCDVLIVARGGGSLEDLWAFNEEVVARAIHACELPVVTGIGHEIDFTIADFAADRRAATPSAAAELVSPDQAEWMQQLARQQQRLAARIRDRLERGRQALDWLERRLQQQHPGSRLRAQAQRLDELEGRLHQVRRGMLRHKRVLLSELSARLHRHIPLHRLTQLQIHHENLRQRLHAMLRLTLERKQQRLNAASRALDAVSPLATLGRGYAIVRTLPEQRVLRDAREATPGEAVEARLARGRLICTVSRILG
ncbi:MAG: exodeoxyribonuclease VII large subunit [Gammaproteobacteria bacterium]|nr:exodeoxyribonuclease VII large subunit [Gammaproteobacteria bacterium]